MGLSYHGAAGPATASALSAAAGKPYHRSLTCPPRREPVVPPRPPPLDAADDVDKHLVMSLLRPVIAALAVLPLLAGCDEPPKPSVNLYRAVHIGDLDQIKRHLYWRTDINRPGPDGNYPLHVAVSDGRVAIARELIRNGAELDVRDAEGHTPLHVALANGKVPAARLLLDEGADDDLQALLFDLMRDGVADRDTLELLASRGVNLNELGPDGQAPLQNAAGETPLALADAGDEPMLRTLLTQYGAVR
jgi:ankyrin repeat protein